MHVIAHALAAMIAHKLEHYLTIFLLVVIVDFILLLYYHTHSYVDYFKGGSIVKNVENMYYGIVRMSNKNIKALATCGCRCFGTSDSEQIQNMSYNVASNNYA